MIDAIRPYYSSTHGGRKENLIPQAQTFTRSVVGAGDMAGFSRMAKKTTGRDLHSTLAVGGCIGAGCFILNLLANADQLMKSDFVTLKNISKATGIVALVGFLCFGAFKLLEKAIVKD